tara:strand:- start:758 stop:1156 length:399 start_codon:yes stop_codon:yes gene_type:complete
MFKKSLMLAITIFLPFSLFSQNNIHDIPKELRIFDNEYQSANVAVYMETCIRTLHTIFTRNGIPMSNSRVGSFQICGCSFDKIRTEFDEDTYLKILENSQKVLVSIVDKNVKECTVKYSDYWINQYIPEVDT